LLDIRNLHVGYDQSDGSLARVVHGVDLRIRRGEVHGLIGESGSGKSQTSFSVLGLLPTGGAWSPGPSTSKASTWWPAAAASTAPCAGRRSPTSRRNP